MKEISEILDRVSALENEDRAVLATVVDLKGSGYRLPGARMLITKNGEMYGTVSGGCLEADVLERAKRVMTTGAAEIFTYDTTVEEDSVFSLNMGCRGVMRILIEPVGRETGIVAKLREVYRTRTSVATAVLISSGPSGLAVGRRIYAGTTEEDGFSDPDRLLDLVPQLRDDLLTFSGSTSHFEAIEYETEGGLLEFAFETLRPAVQVLILGAGADAIPLAEIAGSMGWEVKVFDHRSAFLHRERFPGATELVMVDRDKVPAVVADDRTAVVTINHNYQRDKMSLGAALHSDAFCVSALGPKKRTQQILAELTASGVVFDPERLSRLRSPAGLDIGGDSPETIAIAVIAEIQSVLKHRTGGPLRDREAPIYDRK